MQLHWNYWPVQIIMPARNSALTLYWYIFEAFSGEMKFFETENKCNYKLFACTTLLTVSFTDKQDTYLYQMPMFLKELSSIDILTTDFLFPNDYCVLSLFLGSQLSSRYFLLSDSTRFIVPLRLSRCLREIALLKGSLGDFISKD